jgi:GLPGLI family protein
MVKPFWLGLIPLLLAGPAFSQQPFSDAEITFAVRVELPAGTSPAVAASFAGSRLVWSFKNYLFRYDMQLGRTTYTNIRNERDRDAVTLIDAGPSKYLIRMSSADLARESARYQGITFTDSDSTRKIAGYVCRKATGREASGSTFTVYYAPQLVPEFRDYSARFKNLNGLPLEFRMTNSHDVTMIMTATSVNLAPQPAARFQAPTSGYREITYKELEKLRNR